MSTRLAIIPARGGSKRIPRKNVKHFCDKPMIAWSIEAALKSGCFDRVVVSTDDPEIADVASQLGAEAPFLRPPDLSDDHATTGAVMSHAVSWMIANKHSPSEVCCIYATAPFVNEFDLRRGLEILDAKDCDFAFSVTRYSYPIQRAVMLTDEGRVKMFKPENLNTRSQDLQDAFHDAGQFYWGRAEAWLANKPVLSGNSFPVVLPGYRVQDIDTLEDWDRAEYLFRAIQLKKKLGESSQD